MLKTRPTTLDLLLFAHLTLLLTPVWPNPLFVRTLRRSHPSLVAHHDLVFTRLFRQSWSTVNRLAPLQTEPAWYEMFSFGPKSSERSTSKTKSRSERDFERGRWLWMAGAAAAMIGYVFASGIVKIKWIELGAEEDMEETEETLARLEDPDDEETVVLVAEDPEGEVEEVIIVTPDD